MFVTSFIEYLHAPDVGFNPEVTKEFLDNGRIKVTYSWNEPIKDVRNVYGMAIQLVIIVDGSTRVDK